MNQPTLFSRMRRHGLVWTLRRVLREIYAPETRLGRALRPATAIPWAMIRFLHRTTRRRVASREISLRQTLTLFYDLDVAPITYDFAVALACAEARRRELGLADLHVVFVPGHDGGLRPEVPAYEAVVDADSRRWRLHNICVPLTGLVAACRGYTICNSRRQAADMRMRRGALVLPEGYDPAFPLPPAAIDCQRVAAARGESSLFQAPPQARAYVRQWIDAHAGGRKLITITLRHYGFMPSRNSNLAAWSAFARGLDPRKYCVVIIPDTDSAMQPLPESFAACAEFREACWNIGLRAAIYEAAWLNLGSSGGPMALCWFSAAARYIIFKIVVPDVPQATEEFIAARGYRIGETPPFAGPFQKWVWEPDDLELIEREFAAMAARLAEAQARST